MDHSLNGGGDSARAGGRDPPEAFRTGNLNVSRDVKAT